MTYLNQASLAGNILGFGTDESENNTLFSLDSYWFLYYRTRKLTYNNRIYSFSRRDYMRFSSERTVIERNSNVVLPEEPEKVIRIALKNINFKLIKLEE